MRRPLYLTVCLAGGLALAASGCGESSPKTGTTTVASASTGTTVQTATPSPSGGPTAPSGGATGPSGGSTGPSGGHAVKQTPAEAAKAAEARAEARVLRTKRAAELRIAQIRARFRSESAAQKKAQLEASKRAVRKKHKPYPTYVQTKFTATCETAKGSASQCACILSKQEFSSVEAALSFGELLALELALEHGTTIQAIARPPSPQPPVPLPGDIRGHVEQCLGGK